MRKQAENEHQLPPTELKKEKKDMMNGERE